MTLQAMRHSTDSIWIGSRSLTFQHPGEAELHRYAAASGITSDNLILKLNKLRAQQEPAPGSLPEEYSSCSDPRER